MICETDGRIYAMNRESVYKLYYQQPKLGFHLMSLVVTRLTSGAQGNVALSGENQ